MQEVPAGARLGPSPGNARSISEGLGSVTVGCEPVPRAACFGAGAQNTIPAQLGSIAKVVKRFGAWLSTSGHRRWGPLSRLLGAFMALGRAWCKRDKGSFPGAQCPLEGI